MHMHCIGKDKLDALIAHYKLSGVEARQHKNSKRKPAKALSYEDTRRVLDFILNYSEVNGIQLPGRTPKHWKTDGRLLPTNVTKKTVYDEYFLSCQRGNFHNVKICTFRKLWQQLYPFVRTLLPASDLCWTCQSASYKIAEAANKSDEHKQQIIRDLQAHHDLVKQEREHYKTVVEGTRDCVSTCLSENESPTINHVSFDFAQQVHYPCDPLQPGPIFFKTPRKCGLFGLNSEPLGTQVNYLIDEAHACGKGANTVISYLHHYLATHAPHVLQLLLHADNCTGQNKNNYVIWYILWRTLTGHNNSITLSFLIAGHTKFSPDAGFGLLKKEFRKTKVDCLADIAEVVNKSSRLNTAQLVGSESGPSDVPVHQWDTFLAQFFKKVPKIKSYQHFHANNTGALSVQEHCKAPKIFHNIIKEMPDRNAFPDVVLPGGLSVKRQWYLYKDIREFVREDQKDVVTPMPTTPLVIPEPESSSDEENEPAPPPPKKGKRAPRGH